MSQKRTAPKTAGGSLVLTTSYGDLDGVNRISSAAKIGPRTPWSQTFACGYRFSNLTRTGDGLPSGLNRPSYDSAANRCNVSGFGCGFAANLTGYDAENRQIHLYDGVYWNCDCGATRPLASEYGSRPLGNRPDCVTCYLTADHPASTRLVTDGTTGQVKRRSDYHPFGREVNPGHGDRSTVTGCASNAFPAGFTGKERDAESGLDYFGFRYMSSAQGRFTSPDAPFNDQHPEDTQSWNLYTYGRNNPLAFVDPTGQYVCGSTISKDECATFQKSLDQAQISAMALKDKYGAGSKQYTTAQRAIDAYGRAGVDNGVTVDVGNTGKYGAITAVAGAAGAKTADNPTGQKVNVTFGTGILGEARPTLAAHEGSHVADGSDRVRSGFSAATNPTPYRAEVNAYQVQSNIGQGLGWQFQTVLVTGLAPYLLNVLEWAPANTSNVINAILMQQYGLLPTDQRRAFHRFVKVMR